MNGNIISAGRDSCAFSGKDSECIEVKDKCFSSENLKTDKNIGVCSYSCCDVCACDNTAMRNTLIQMGMTDVDIEKYFELTEYCADEKIELLTKCRKNILNDIHDKQKTLDIIDFLIYYNRKRRDLNE